jgi:hypothetical protein
MAIAGLSIGTIVYVLVSVRKRDPARSWRGFDFLKARSNKVAAAGAVMPLERGVAGFSATA